MSPAMEQTLFISKNAHQVARLLIASYFIGASTGVVPFETGRALASILLPVGIANQGFTMFVFTSAFLILIGRQVRPAALLLALFIFWSSFMASFGPTRLLGFAEFWRDLVLMSSLLLTYINAPRVFEASLRPARQRRRSRNAKIIQPRRVVVDKAASARAMAARQKQQPAPPPLSADMDDTINLFDRVFDAA